MSRQSLNCARSKSLRDLNGLPASIVLSSIIRTKTKNRTSCLIMKAKRSLAAIEPADDAEGDPRATRRVRGHAPPFANAEHDPLASNATEAVVTPARSDGRNIEVSPRARPRVLFPSSDHPALVTPARGAGATKLTAPSNSPARRRLIFGRVVDEIAIQENVRCCYGVVKKLTGSIGGNASGGPIYGELTIGSMQKVVRIMKSVTGLDASSRFIDVGSGIGKPSIHVAQDPGVDFSYGIEIDVDRWLLGMTCLRGILDAAVKQAVNVPDEAKVGHRCVFDHGDIRRARTFEPFTHVYMFSIGFPPALWLDLAEMWNRSHVSQYLICYHGPKDVITNYEFHVELITQTPTSMHGSKEGHTAYIYKRVDRSLLNAGSPISCDPAFSAAWEVVNGGLEALRSHVESRLSENTKSGPVTRAGRRIP